MNFSESFSVAAKSDAVGSKTFYGVTAASAALLALPGTQLEVWLHPLLVIAAIVAIACTAITTIYQTQGNHLLRASQLSDALGSTVGDKMREGYFNSPMSPSFMRLATTVLENTLFTRHVLAKMLIRERQKIVIYGCILLLLLVIRWTSTSWLLLLAQTLFSADLILHWIRMERFRVRTSRVHECLRQFFLQNGSIETPNGMTIVLVAFTDYECAKDEASLLLDTPIFEKLNPIISQRWEEMKVQLNIK